MWHNNTDSGKLKALATFGWTWSKIGVDIAVLRILLVVLEHVLGPGLERKYLRVHRQTDRPTKVKALFSWFFDAKQLKRVIK